MKSTKSDISKKKLSLVESDESNFEHSSPQTNIFPVLQQGHQELKCQMKALLRFTHEGRLEESKAIAVRFQVSFHAHAEAAERSLYSFLPSDPKWKAKLRVLCRLVETHLKREFTLLKRCRKMVSKDEGFALLNRFLYLKNSVRRESNLFGGLSNSLALLDDRRILLALH